MSVPSRSKSTAAGGRAGWDTGDLLRESPAGLPGGQIRKHRHNSARDYSQ
ncbi:hypothetical protein GCM10027161_12660 [Microbispora hainanensis]